MPTLKQLEQEKAALDLKIALSVEAAKKVAEDLEKARHRQAAIDQCNQEIARLLKNHNLRIDDLIPTALANIQTPNIKSQQKDGFLSIFGLQSKVKYKNIHESFKRGRTG